MRLIPFDKQQANKSQDNDIAGIFNYCNRWCERCPFNDRCRTYKEEQARKADQPLREGEDPFAVGMEFIAESLESAIQMMMDWAEREGIEMNPEELAANALPKEEAPSEAQQHLINESLKYGVNARKWGLANQEWLDTIGIPLWEIVGDEDEVDFKKENLPADKHKLVDALAYIVWNMHFIRAKVSRAVSGKNEGCEAWEDPVQNDFNGSAKIAMIAIKQSITAWEIYRAYFVDQTDEILDFLVALQRLYVGMKKEFPNAHKFIRPGFDE